MFDLAEQLEFTATSEDGRVLDALAHAKRHQSARGEYITAVDEEGSNSFGTRTQIGTGWNAYTFTGVTDLNADTYPDVIARDTSGALWLYPGNGSDGFGTRSQIGTGWNAYTFAGIGDFNGDGNPDVIAREDATGILWLYPRTATAFNTRQQTGSSW
ncbi:VCBS repeat-containing protein [Streptomyces sp. NPDC002088]|uniref:FG-GAP repeat domain-containing protein n=1 Tax=Streptomyces sp. NPDC002088 TaxID=3154665 RepID=UPI00332EC12B